MCIRAMVFHRGGMMMLNEKKSAHHKNPEHDERGERKKCQTPPLNKLSLPLSLLLAVRRFFTQLRFTRGVEHNML